MKDEVAKKHDDMNALKRYNYNFLVKYDFYWKIISVTFNKMLRWIWTQYSVSVVHKTKTLHHLATCKKL